MRKVRIKSPLVWYGGKSFLLPHLLRLVPPGGEPYCEPFCGAASLFFSRIPAPVEVLNDLYDDLITLYRCLQDPELFKELRSRLEFTPFSRKEMLRACEMLSHGKGSPVDRAWALFTKMNQIFSAVQDRCTEGNWRASRKRSKTSSWWRRIDLLDLWFERLRNVQLESRDALKVIKFYDNKDAIFYVDPPYYPDTRRDPHGYKYNCSAEYHDALAELLMNVKGKVVLSGYACPAYEVLERIGWFRLDFPVASLAAKRALRVESLWLNFEPSCCR